MSPPSSRAAAAGPRRPEPAEPRRRFRRRDTAQLTIAAAAALAVVDVEAAAAGGRLSVADAQKKLADVGAAEADFPTPDGAVADAGDVVSAWPYVTVIDGFLSDRECDFLRSLAHERLVGSTPVEVADTLSGNEVLARYAELQITRREEAGIPLLGHIAKRMHRAVRVPDSYSETLQIRRFATGDRYEEHEDSVPADRLSRPATLVVYLGEVAGGGDTLFPRGRRDCSPQWRRNPKGGGAIFGSALCCSSPELDAPETVRIRPKKGRAVLFFSHRPDGFETEASTHISCPVTEGEKWIAQRWFRYSPQHTGPSRDTAPPDLRFDGLAGVGEEGRGSRLRKLSDDSPRLFLQTRFLTEDERAHLEAVATQYLRDDVLPEGEEVETGLMPKEKVVRDPVLSRLAARAMHLARLPPAEPSCLVFRRLQRGGFEPRHLDASPWAGRAKGAIGKTAVLPASVVIFLNTPNAGGDFVFPAASSSDPAAEAACARGGDVAACCAAEGLLRVPPRSGDALLIFSRKVSGSREPRAEHVVCPVANDTTSLVAEVLFVFDDWRGLDEAEELDKLDLPPKKTLDKTIKFINPRDHVVKVRWMSPDDRRQRTMGDIAPRASWELNTMAGHIFKLYAGGEFLETVSVTEEKGQQVHLVAKAGAEGEPAPAPHKGHTQAQDEL